MAADYKANYRIIFNDHTENDKLKTLKFKGFNTPKLNTIIDLLVKQGRVMREDFREGGTAKVEKF